MEDNGIGRKKANEHKSEVDRKHQSKGTKLTAERVKTLNENYDDEISIKIIDMYDEHNQQSGTKVIIYFPFTTLEKLD